MLISLLHFLYEVTYTLILPSTLSWAWCPSRSGPYIGSSCLTGIDVLAELRGLTSSRSCDLDCTQLPSLTSGPSMACRVYVRPFYQKPHTVLLSFEKALYALPLLYPWYLSLRVACLIVSPIFFTMHWFADHFINLCYIPTMLTKPISNNIM